MTPTRGLRLAMLAGLVLVVTEASAQQPLEGWWRVDSAREGGVVEVRRTSAGSFTYERRSRPTLREPIRVERGVAERSGSRLLTQERGQANGLARALGGSSRSQAPTWRGRYVLREGSLQGVRTRGNQVVVERLVRLRTNERVGNALTLLLDGDAFVDLRRRLSAAQTSIDVQAYAWVDDATGRSIADILMAKARAGIPVRCLLETESRWISRALKKKDVTHGLHKELERAGVQVILQNSLGRGLLRYQRDLGSHDHTKLIVIDRRIAYIGGQNFATENEHDWHGQQVRIEGPAALDAQRLFTQHWTRAGGQAAILPPDGPPAFAGDMPAEVLVRTPGVSDAVTERTLEEIERAKHRILIATPQLHHEVVVQALIRAAARGVRVVALVPEYSTDPQWLTRELLAARQNDLIRAGVELYSYLPRPLDIKAAAFDGRVSILGSAPLNGTKMDEVMLCVPDARFTRELEARVFRPGLKVSRRRQLIHRSRLRKLKERIYRRVNRAI